MYKIPVRTFRRRSPAGPLSAGGFSLLEVMVAVLVLSTAMLSLAFAQVVSMRGSNSAYLRSQAVILAFDMAEKMRANRAQAANYVIGLGDPTPALASPASIANADVVAWRNAVTAALPSARSSIAFAWDSVARDRFLGTGTATITIEWFDPSQDNTAAQTQTYTYSSRIY